MYGKMKLMSLALITIIVLSISPSVTVARELQYAPEAQPTTLTIPPNPTNPAANQSFTLSGTLTAGTTPVSGKNITLFRSDPSGDVAGPTTTTDTNGAYTFTVSESQGVYHYYAYFAGDTTYNTSASAVSLIVGTVTPTTLTIATNTTNPAANQSFTLSGTLTAGTTPVSGKNITLFRSDPSGTGDVRGPTTTTDTNGAYTFTRSESQGVYHYYAYFASDATYNKSGSAPVTLTVGNLTPTTLTIATNTTNPAANQSFTLSGTLTANATPLSSKNITLFRADPSGTWGAAVTTTTTDTNGTYTFTVSESAQGVYHYYSYFDGDATYNYFGSAVVALPVGTTTTISIFTSNDKPLVNQPYTLHGFLLNGSSGEFLADQPIDLTIDGPSGEHVTMNTTTDANGTYAFTRSEHEQGRYSFTVNLSNTSRDYLTSESTLSVTVGNSAPPILSFLNTIIITVVIGLVGILLYVYVRRGIGRKQSVERRHETPLLSSQYARIRTFWDIAPNLNIERNMLAATAVLLTVVTNVVVLSNTPILRPVFGFAFLTVLPGLLLFQIIKIRGRRVLEKIVLCWGLSIAFVMFATLAINGVLPLLGYNSPLSTLPFLFSLDIAVLLLTIIMYRAGDNVRAFEIPRLQITGSNLKFFVIPVLFPFLSVIGASVMRTSGNNVLLLVLFFLMLLYVAYAVLSKNRCLKNLYPALIYSISLSVLLAASFRTNHIVGVDIHAEFFQFEAILNDQLMLIPSFPQQSLSPLYSSVVSIVLPVAYELVLGVDKQTLFNTIYSLLFSIVPLVVYSISRKYLEERWALIVAFSYIAQVGFVWANAYSRASIAILFFALAFMVLFGFQKEAISTNKKLALFLLFVTCGILSHYSTTFMFLFLIVAASVPLALIARKRLLTTRTTRIYVYIALLLFFIMFAWYSLISNSSALQTGYLALGGAFSGSFSNFFSFAGRAGAELFGTRIAEHSIAYLVELACMWGVFLCLAIGVITVFVKRREMTTLWADYPKPTFLLAKFEIMYFTVAVAGVILLAVSALLPTTFYGRERMYLFVSVFLSVFFAVGLLVISNWVIRFLRPIRVKLIDVLPKKVSPRLASIASLRAPVPLALILALMIVGLNFLSITGASYAVVGEPRGVILATNGLTYSTYIVHDQETEAIKWVAPFSSPISRIAAADSYGRLRLVSQGHFNYYTAKLTPFTENASKVTYLFLDYYNAIEKRYVVTSDTTQNIDENSVVLSNSSRIFDAGGSQLYLNSLQQT